MIDLLSVPLRLLLKRGFVQTVVERARSDVHGRMEGRGAMDMSVGGERPFMSSP